MTRPDSPHLSARERAAHWLFFAFCACMLALSLIAAGSVAYLIATEPTTKEHQK